MKTLEGTNPVALLLFFVYVTGLAMFIPFPFLIAASLICGMGYYYLTPGDKKGSFTAFAWLLFLALTIANPIISHKGETVLLFINGRPITLESFYFGLNSSAMILSALYWFKTLTLVMSSDKLIYLTSLLSKNLSLIISMTVRFVPLFSKQRRSIKQTQLAMGRYNDDSLTADIRSNIRVFSILITWALEGGITSADSMEARGFSLGRRSCFRREKMGLFDISLVIIMSTLFGVCIYSRLSGGLSYSFYPRAGIAPLGISGAAGLMAYTLLAALPMILKAEVSLKWRLLRSGI